MLCSSGNALAPGCSRCTNPQLFGISPFAPADFQVFSRVFEAQSFILQNRLHPQIQISNACPAVHVLKGLSSKPSGKCIVAPIFWFFEIDIKFWLRAYFLILFDCAKFQSFKKHQKAGFIGEKLKTKSQMFFVSFFSCDLQVFKF